jgi:succinate dehydrogenase / fumarate reductase flavoprotein subunit
VGDDREPGAIPEEERDYYLERKYPAFGNLSPRDISSRAAKEVCDESRGVGEMGRGVYLDFKDAIGRVGQETIKARYGNLFDMYDKITGENPYERPMRIYPASHYTMGGLWVDYNLMSNIEGLFVMGEANFSDHGANRLGASALMQGLADGYFVIADSIGNYLGANRLEKIDPDLPEFREAEAKARAGIQKLLDVNGTKSVDSFHKELGHIMWEGCGMARNEKGLTKAIGQIADVRDRFWKEVRVTGVNEEFNVNLEQAARVADFLEFADVLCYDALDRDESCGAHFREEHQTPDGEAKRNDEDYTYVAAWEYKGVGNRPELTKEPLVFENVELSTRSYK